MTSSVKISPSILSAIFSQLGREVAKLEKAGADLIHVDVMDGHFVPNITIGPVVIKSLKKYTSLPFDVHLMISPVHKYIKNFAQAGADIIMSVNPGFGGQKLIKSTLKKSKKLKKEIVKKKLKVKIEMDGGINFKNAGLVRRSGVDIIVSGTTIFKENNGNYKKNIKLLKTN